MKQRKVRTENGTGLRSSEEEFESLIQPFAAAASAGPRTRHSCMEDPLPSLAPPQCCASGTGAGRSVQF